MRIKIEYNSTVRHLAIDYGMKRIGLALSDEGGRFATPFEVLDLSTDESIEMIVQLVKAESIQQIVIGFPLNMDGTQSPMSKRVIDFARILKSKSGLDPIFIDERLSSFDAEQQLLDMKKSGAKMTRKMKKERFDALSAASFLQAYLDGKLKPVSLETTSHPDS